MDTDQQDFSEEAVARQREEFTDLLYDEPQLKEGQTWYLVATRWYNQWEEFLGVGGSRGGGPHPGPVDNSPILEEDGSLKAFARERMDFVIRSEAIWKRLEELYGGGPPIPRAVIRTMWSNSVETHPLKLQFLRSADMETAHWGVFSKGAKIKEVRNTMCERMGLALEDVRMWDYHNDQKLKILSDPLCTLSEERILDKQKLLFEERLPNGKWPKLATKRDREYDARHQERVPPGLCGLTNLGNTCFMNSGLQCLSNTAPLAEFMVSGRCDDEVNRDNPLGTKGELLVEFAELLQEMWSGRMSSIAPRDFKWKLERFAPQFSGWQQHDSHELLSFLLDGLHEDLNRVKKKPYFETNEFEGMPEVEAAEKSWKQHIARNDSFVVDLCHGLLRSEVNCNVCDRVSKVFDPFMYLSVPLPEAKTRNIYARVWSGDFSQKPVKYMFEVPKYGTVQDLVEEVARVTGFDVDRLHVSDVYSHRFFKHFRRDEALTAITDRDVIYVTQGTVGPAGPARRTVADSDGEDELKEEKPAEGEQERQVDVCLLWKAEEKSTYYSYSSTVQRTSRDPPLIMGVPETGTYKQYYDLLSQRLARFFDQEKVAEARQAAGKEEEEEEQDTEKEASEGENGGDQKNNEEAAAEEEAKAGASKEKRLFKFALTDRYGQLAPGYENVSDDTEIELAHGQNVVLLLDAEGCFKGVFDSKAAEALEEDASCSATAEGEAGMQLSQCISLFAEREQLSADDPWYCSQCKEHRQAYKKFDLWQMPKILIIQLKRFSYRNKHWREKIESHVNFPLRGLDMTEHVRGPITPGEEPIYDLYAISNHYGALGGGHYTAFAQNANNRRWYKFDDSSVSEVADPQSVVTPAAYILFYRRRDAALPASFTMPTPAKYLAEEREQAEGGQRASSDDDEEEEPSSGTPAVGSSAEGVGAALL